MTEKTDRQIGLIINPLKIGVASVSAEIIHRVFNDSYILEPPLFQRVSLKLDREVVDEFLSLAGETRLVVRIEQGKVFNVCTLRDVKLSPHPRFKTKWQRDGSLSIETRRDLAEEAWRRITQDISMLSFHHKNAYNYEKHEYVDEIHELHVPQFGKITDRRCGCCTDLTIPSHKQCSESTCSYYYQDLPSKFLAYFKLSESGYEKGHFEVSSNAEDKDKFSINSGNLLTVCNKEEVLNLLCAKYFGKQIVLPKE